MKDFYEFRDKFLEVFPEKSIQDAIRLHDAAETLEQVIRETLGEHPTEDERSAILGLLGIEAMEPPKGAEFFRNEHKKAEALVRRMKEKILVFQKELLDKNQEMG